MIILWVLLMGATAPISVPAFLIIRWWLKRMHRPHELPPDHFEDVWDDTLFVQEDVHVDGYDARDWDGELVIPE